MEIIPVRTRLFQLGEALAPFVRAHVPELRPGDVLAVTSKIAALSQGRVLTPGFDKRRVVRDESEETAETPWCLLARRGGDWSANAGVDESNGDGRLILLPSAPKASAAAWRRELADAYGVPDLALILTDTRLVPLRRGTMGVALAWAGLEPIVDYVGRPDLYGRPLKMTQANVVHALAAAAVLAMGEGAERVPLAVLRGFDVPRRRDAAGDVGDLAVLPTDDLYRFAYASGTASDPLDKPYAP